MNHPALRVAGYYLGGVLVGNEATLPVHWLWAGVAGVVVGWAWCWWMHLLFSLALWQRELCHENLAGWGAQGAELGRGICWRLGIFLLGWANYAGQTTPSSPNDLRHWVPDAGAIARVEGTVLSVPRIQKTTSGTRLQVSMELERAQTNGVWRAAVGRVMVLGTNSLNGTISKGKRITVDGVLAPPRPAVAPGFFDRKQQLARQAIYHELQTDVVSEYKVTPSVRELSWSELFQIWGRATLGRGLPENDPAVELLWAMAVGWRTGLSGDVAASFMQSGTMHLFAISGLHVALVAGIMLGLLRVCRLGRQGAAALVIPLLWFYAGATGWQPSAVRATVMMTLLLGGWVLKRPVNVLNSLGLAAFLILLWDPQQIFRASFQLSFVVVFSLACVVPPVAQWLENQARPDPYLPRLLWSRWQQGLFGASRWFLGALAVSAGAWLASMPLVAHHFNLFNPVALLANVPVVVCGMAALASCLRSLLLGVWLEPVSVWFNHAAWFFMNAMMAISQWAAELPGGWQYVRSPQGWMMAGWYFVLFGFGTGWAWHSARRRWMFLGVGMFAVLLLLVWQKDRVVVRMTFLPQGPMVHVEGEDLLVDCGDEWMAGMVVPRQLRVRGVDELDHCVVTHLVTHHAGGLEMLKEACLLRQVYRAQSRSSSPVGKQVTGLELVAGDRVGRWDVIHPAQGEDFPRSTDDALVLRGKFHEVTVLLLSDLGHDGRQALTRKDVNLQADVLALSVPDRSLPVDLGFLRQVAPKVIVVQDSQFPVTERASTQWLARLRESNATVLSVKNLGGIRLTIEPDGWRLENAEGGLFSQ